MKIQIKIFSVLALALLTMPCNANAYETQKPFVDNDGYFIKKTFFLYNDLTGEDATQNKNEFEEWEKNCKDIEKDGKSNVETTTISEGPKINGANSSTIYTCKITKCKENYIESDGSGALNCYKPQGKKANQSQNQLEKDIDVLTKAYDKKIEELVKSCYNSGKKINSETRTCE